ncbi:MAG: DUF3789 domain-containing protein [Clostridia bacterium]|nr:DUF3789 domain-containing protein [Clostridia bacterium]
MTALCFFIGLMVGGTLGVVVMCCFQIGKDSETHAEKINRQEK